MASNNSIFFQSLSFDDTEDHAINVDNDNVQYFEIDRLKAH